MRKAYDIVEQNFINEITLIYIQVKMTIKQTLVKYEIMIITLLKPRLSRIHIYTHYIMFQCIL